MPEVVGFHPIFVAAQPTNIKLESNHENSLVENFIGCLPAVRCSCRLFIAGTSQANRE